MTAATYSARTVSSVFKRRLDTRLFEDDGLELELESVHDENEHEDSLQTELGEEDEETKKNKLPLRSIESRVDPENSVFSLSPFHKTSTTAHMRIIKKKKTPTSG